MTRKTTVCATFTEKLAIKVLLDERLHPVEGTDRFRYEDGWSDGIVAYEVRKDSLPAKEALSGNVTAKIRNECFGKLHNYGKKLGAPSSSVKLRVEVLEERLYRLLNWMTLHGGLPPKQCDTILNGVPEETGE